MTRSIFFLVFVSSALLAEPSTPFIKKHAVAFKNPQSLPHQVLQEIKGYKIISVGEIHGTREAPALVLALIRLLATTGKSVLLGLEIPVSEQPVLDRFIKTGDINALKASPFFQRDFQDGRSSRAMVKLLDEIRFTAGIQVVGFDPINTSSGQDRDEKMAVELTKAYQATLPDYVVFLAGNIHAAISVGTLFDPQYRPMGYQLIHQQGALFSEKDSLPLKVRNEKGSTWCCLGSAVSDCKVHPMNFGVTNYSSAISADFYYLKEADLFEGYKGTLFAREVTASLPLLEQE